MEEKLKETYYYSFNDLIKSLLALLLCAIFSLPYFYYNLPIFELLPQDNSFLVLSDDADFQFINNGKWNNVTLWGNLKQGELQLSPNISPNKNYQFLITTGNAVISAKDSVLSILYYQGNDDIYYTHVVCKKGHAVISLYKDKESKVSSDSKYLHSGYEALIYKDETQNKIGFVRFEGDGTNPRPNHGVYTRETKKDNDLYEYLEIDPLYYSAFLSSGKYTAPTWDYSLDLGLGDNTEGQPTDEETNGTSANPWDFTICSSIMYFSKYTPWGEEDTLLEEGNTDYSPSDDFSNPTYYGAQKDIIVNDNMKTLGGQVPLILNSLTIHENYPGNALQIIGEVRVNSLILIASTGKDESHLIEKDSENRALPISNYFKTTKDGAIVIPSKM